MTKRLDPEIKALRAITRALEPLNERQAQRSLSLVVAAWAGMGWVSLPKFRKRQP